MNKQIDNLRDLFIEQGRELYDGTRQEKGELVNIKSQAKNPELKQIIQRQLDQAEAQGDLLKESFEQINVSPEGERNDICETIFRKAKSLIDRSKENEVRDAAIVNSIQRLNHHKITGLGSLRSYSREIGEDGIADAIQDVLDLEKAVDIELTELAETEINNEAVAAATA